MRRPSRAGLSLVLAFCAGIPLAAQNLESIGKEKPFTLSGGISLNQVIYSSRGIAPRRDPWRYIASGNLNLSLYGWTVPLTFAVANHNTTFSQPFNQYSLHPTWKWITAHVGYTSVSFSPYTVNGHNFLGGAVDVAPEGKLKFSALYGRFLKAVEYDTAMAAAHSPSYQRMGYGLKVTYGSGTNLIDLIMFHARDEAGSVTRIPDSLDVTPQENLVFSIGGGKTIFKHFRLKAELATSAITKDTRAEKTTHRHPLARAGIGFAPRLSSAYYQAFKSSFDYQHEAWLLGVAYERIDPGYRTLGAYYFNNDLTNLTVNSSAGLLEGKLNIAASAGVQRDNLDKAKVSTMRRMVGSLNLNYMPSERFNLSAAYSGFQSFTNIRSRFETINQYTPFENLDTLNFTQISRNASLSGMYNLRGTESKKQHISVQLTWQEAADKQRDVEQNSGTRFYNFSGAYAINLLPQNMTTALAFNATINAGPFMQTRMFGPTASVTRSFLQRKFRATFSTSYNHTYSHGVKINSVFNSRWSGVLSIRSQHNIHFSAVIVKRTTDSKAQAQRKITEFTGTMGYTYSFGSSR